MNTIDKLCSITDRACADLPPDLAAELRAVVAEALNMNDDKEAIAARLMQERGAWSDRAAGLAQVIDRVDDFAEYLDHGEAANGIRRQIERSHVIMQVDGSGREVWGDPPETRTIDGEPIWWP